MKSYSYVVFFAVVLLLVGCGSSAKPIPLSTTEASVTNPTVESTTCQTLTVSEADNWYPVFLVNPDNQVATGVGVELIQKLATDLNLKISIKTGIPWKRQLVMLEEGQLDMILGAYWTEERTKTYFVTEPFMQDNITVFVLKGQEFPLTQFSDLKGKSGSAPSGWSLGEAFDQYAKENLQLDHTPKDNAAIFNKVLAGYSDYAITAYWDGMAYLHQEKLVDKIVPLSYTITTNNVHLMLSRRSPCQNQVTQINQLIKQYQQAGLIEAMLDNYRAK